MVRLGRALNECKSKAEADTIAEVIVSQVSAAMQLHHGAYVTSEEECQGMTLHAC